MDHQNIKEPSATDHVVHEPGEVSTATASMHGNDPSMQSSWNFKAHSMRTGHHQQLKQSPLYGKLLRSPVAADSTDLPTSSVSHTHNNEDFADPPISGLRQADPTSLTTSPRPDQVSLHDQLPEESFNEDRSPNEPQLLQERDFCDYPNDVTAMARAISDTHTPPPPSLSNNYIAKGDDDSSDSSEIDLLEEAFFCGDVNESTAKNVTDAGLPISLQATLSNISFGSGLLEIEQDHVIDMLPSPLYARNAVSDAPENVIKTFPQILDDSDSSSYLIRESDGKESPSSTSLQSKEEGNPMYTVENHNPTVPLYDTLAAPDVAEEKYDCEVTTTGSPPRQPISQIDIAACSADDSVAPKYNESSTAGSTTNTKEVDSILSRYRKRERWGFYGLCCMLLIIVLLAIALTLVLTILRKNDSSTVMQPEASSSAPTHPSKSTTQPNRSITSAPSSSATLPPSLLSPKPNRSHTFSPSISPRPPQRQSLRPSVKITEVPHSVAPTNRLQNTNRTVSPSESVSLAPSYFNDHRSTHRPIPPSLLNESSLHS